MRIRFFGCVSTIWVLVWAVQATAATHYVVPPETEGVTPDPPYTSWETAGTNLIEVVAEANAGSAPRIVLVTNGTYQLTNQIIITRPMVIRGVNGPEHTILDGGWGRVSALYAFNFYSSAANSDATALDGLTITNYNLTSWTARVVYGNQYSLWNCHFVNNRINGYGIAGFNYGGTVTNCLFKGNEATYGGGALRLAYKDTTPRTTRISDCRFEDNRSINWHGGAIQAVNALGSISNCVFVGNTASGRGGAIEHTGVNEFDIINCTFRDSSVLQNGVAKQGDGGAIFAETNVTLRNSLVAESYTKNNGGGVYLHQGVIESSTIASNKADVAGGGLYLAGAVTGLNNIAYFNLAPQGANWTNTTQTADFTYTCASPTFAGDGNFDADPRFAAPETGDWRVLQSSPCVNAGLNQAWMASDYPFDLAGEPRILDKTVDLGAYERRITGSILLLR